MLFGSLDGVTLIELGDADTDNEPMGFVLLVVLIGVFIDVAAVVLSDTNTDDELVDMVEIVVITELVVNVDEEEVLAEDSGIVGELG